MLAARPLALLLALAGTAGPRASASAPELPSGSSRNVVATLVPERDAVRPGQTLTVGFQLKMAPEWHTYWKNPGDAGLPTRVRWRLPEGFEAGPLQWPRPSRIPADPLMSYGYDGEVLLLAEIRTPPALPAARVTIGARIDWLECKEACLPGKAELDLELPVSLDPRPLAGWERAFREARAALPVAAPNVAAEAVAHGPELTLTVGGAGSPAAAYFYPAEADVLAYAAPQRLSAAAGAFRLRLTRADNAPPVERLRGVLEVGEKAYEIDAAVIAGAALAVSSPAETPAAEVPGLLAALGLALVGGLILNLMPCVLPVLSLKVMGFVKQGGDSRSGALRHSLAFSLGVLVFFWILAGALLALRAGGEQIGWGFQLQSPAFVAFLAALFLLVALNLFGVFEVGQSLTGAANAAHRASGLWASFWTGALATLVATPCTAPFMGSALGFALAQPPASTLLVFTALGLGMAAPYVALTGSPALMRLLPRPGRWMETLKQAMAFPMLGTVVFLAWLFGRQVGVSAMAGLLASLLLVGMGAWLYGRGSAGAGATRVALVGGAGLVVAGLLLGISQAQAEPERATGAASGAWEPFSEERLAELRRAGTPVFVDFTADWCLTCQVNDRVALMRPEVQRRFRDEGVVLVKADWTRRDESITRALAAHGRQGVPLYVLYGRGPGAAPRLLPEVLTPGVVLAALDQAFRDGS